MLGLNNYMNVMLRKAWSSGMHLCILGHNSYGAMGSRNAKTQIRYECTGDRSHLECPAS